MAGSSSDTIVTLNFDGVDRQRWWLASLARLPIWVGWRKERLRGRWVKRPYDPATGHWAEADNPTTWGTRSAAEKWASDEGDGVGLMLSDIGDAQLAGIDLDTCRDEKTGVIEAWAQEVIDRFASYTEVSPSGAGVKIFFTLTKSDYERAGRLFGDNRHSRLFKNGSGEHPPAIEVHRSHRYFTLTKKRYGWVRAIRRAGFADLEWVINEAGPRFAGGERGVRGDDTRSGKAWHVGLTMRGASYEALREALLNHSDPEVRAWTRTKGMEKVAGIEERELHRIYDKINGDDDGAGDVFDPWSQERPTPAFPLETLPRVIREFVEEQARVIGGDVSAMAMCALSALSIAIDHRIQLKMMKYGIWLARARLWIALIADPSTKKSVMIRAALRRIKQLQAAAMEAYERAKAEAKENKEEEPPRPLRYTIDDITIEMVAMIAARSPRGLLVDPDELAGWIGSMDRYTPNTGGGTKASPGRVFWIRGYDGGPRNVDRIGRGEIHVPNLSVSIVGGIQPDRLAELRGLESDGLLQRFLPIVVKAATFEQDMPCDDRDYAKLIGELMELDPIWDPGTDEPRPLRMSADGYEVMTDIRRRLFETAKHGDRVSSGFQTFIGKLADIAGSLSIILHMAHFRKRGLELEVSAETVEGAGSILFNFVIPHALAFYAGDRDWREVRRICGWILKQGKEKLTFRDFIRGPLQKKGHDEVRRALEPLETIGWLKPAGPWPTKSWKVPHQVFDQMKGRAEIERRMGEETAALMEKAFAKRRAQKERGT